MSIFFEAIPSIIESRKIVRIPLNISKELPSRGMVMIQGTINGISFTSPLEPDGKGGHWFDVSDILSKDIKMEANQTLTLNIELLKDWIEPNIPEDIMDAIIKADLIVKWNSITTKARWDWLRWIRSTNNPKTRKKRILVACSKLQNGDKNPCCFDRTRCTIPEVSKSGVLID